MYFIVKVCLGPLLYHLIMTLWCLLPHFVHFSDYFHWPFSSPNQWFFFVVVRLENWNWSSVFLRCTSSLPLPRIYPLFHLFKIDIFLYAIYIIQVFKSLYHINHNSKDVVWYRIIVWCNIVTLASDNIILYESIKNSYRVNGSLTVYIVTGYRNFKSL